jgi:hypothetical protein
VQLPRTANRLPKLLDRPGVPLTRSADRSIRGIEAPMRGESTQNQTLSATSAPHRGAHKAWMGIPSIAYTSQIAWVAGCVRILEIIHDRLENGRRDQSQSVRYRWTAAASEVSVPAGNSGNIASSCSKLRQHGQCKLAAVSPCCAGSVCRIEARPVLMPFIRPLP